MASFAAVGPARLTFSNFPIGVNLGLNGYDLARLQDGVFYLDNDSHLDSEDLPRFPT